MTHAAEAFRRIQRADEKIERELDRVDEIEEEAESAENLGMSERAENLHNLANRLKAKVAELQHFAAVAGHQLSLYSRRN